MKALVIFDSTYGNTEKVAQAVGEAIYCPILRVGQVRSAELTGLDLLIAGSPTNGGWFTPDFLNWLKSAPDLKGIRVAAFDTRTTSKIGAFLFGFAAPRLARSLEQNGGSLLVPPEGFIVLDTKGPLKEGELERAAVWAKNCLQQCSSSETDNEKIFSTRN